VIILAGGLGLRLRSVVPDRPKVLALINGMPFLSYILRELSKAGFRDVVLCTGYMGEQIDAEFGECYHKLRLSYSQEESPLGTGGALRLALPMIHSNTVFVLNGDSMCLGDFDEFFSWHNEKKALASIMMTRVRDIRRFGHIQVNRDGQISQFEEKRGEAKPGWINAGIYILNSELIKAIPPDKIISLEREVFTRYVGKSLYGFMCHGKFIDIGVPTSYARAEQVFGKGEIIP
jgi:NDP-sugar pyrophosphorylase family protein